MTTQEISDEFGWFIFKAFGFSIGGFMSLVTGLNLYKYYFVDSIGRVQAGLTGNWLQIEQATFAVSFGLFAAITLSTAYSVYKDFIGGD